MKIGDIVTIRDGSWSRILIDGELLREHLAYGKYENLRYKVILTDCKFPLFEYQPQYHQSNTMLLGIDGIAKDKIVMIQDDQLSPISHKIIIDDKTIEISEESYQNLRKSLVL